MNVSSNRCVRTMLNSLSKSIIALKKDPLVKKLSVPFQRKRKLPLTGLIRFLLWLDAPSISFNLRTFFKNPMTRPSLAALCKRRKLLSPDILARLFERTNQYWNQFLPLRKQYYHKKYRLLACDGSDFTTLGNPADSDSYFPAKKENAKSYNMYHLNAFYNVCTGCFEAALIHSKRYDSERVSFLQLAQRYEKSTPTIFMMDRGFECWDIPLALTRSQNFFIMRVRVPQQHGILSSLELSSRDEEHTFSLKHRHAKTSLLHPQGWAYQKTDESTDLQVTLRIITILKPHGEKDCLVTNLPAQAVTYRQIRYLYHRRWEIETAFRNLKWLVKTIYFHSRQKRQIFQELWAKLILFNLYSMLQKKLGTIRQKGHKHSCKISLSALVQECRIYFLARGHDMHFLENIAKAWVPLRHQRSAPRKVKTQGAKSFQYR